MREHRVLVVCGSGASSTFMAMAMRKEITKRGLDIEVKARSESEIEGYTDEIDAIMLGPHLKGYFNDLKERYSDMFTVILMRSDYYGTLDGSFALDHLLAETGW